MTGDNDVGSTPEGERRVAVVLAIVAVALGNVGGMILLPSIAAQSGSVDAPLALIPGVLMLAVAAVVAVMAVGHWRSARRAASSDE